MADWTSGYAASWSVSYVNPETLADCGDVGGVVSVSVSRNGTDSVRLLETGQMEIDADSLDAAWMRVYMTVDQDGLERVPVATMLFERQSSRIEKGQRRITATGRSVLQPAADRAMERGSFVPAGADGAAYAARLLRSCTPFPVEVDGGFTLVDDLVFDLGCSCLKAVWQVLDAGGWCIRIAGDGTVRIAKTPTAPALELDRAHAGLLLPGVDDDFDIVDVPNRVIAAKDGATAIAVNEDGASVTGRPRRGRWVDKVETSPKLVDGESLEHYAERRLAELSTVTRTYDYEREFWPDVVPYDMVRAALSSNGIEGELRVVKQTLECGRGITVRETAEMEVRL